MRWLARGAGAGDPPAGTAWLGPAEAARAAGLRFPKRRAEYLLARWTAKLALAERFGLPPEPGPLARIEVRNAPSGAPEVYLDGAPAQVAVSLSDRAGWAVCLVGPPAPAFGCDLELVEPRSPRFVADYFTPAERRLVDTAPAADRPVLANLVWSAKESALKALRTGLRLDTRSVEVRLPAGLDRPGWQPLAVRPAGAAELPGWWLRCDRFLLTTAGAGLTTPPVSIEDPPALAAALPRERRPGPPG